MAAGYIEGSRDCGCAWLLRGGLVMKIRAYHSVTLWVVVTAECVACIVLPRPPRLVALRRLAAGQDVCGMVHWSVRGRRGETAAREVHGPRVFIHPRLTPAQGYGEWQAASRRDDAALTRSWSTGFRARRPCFREMGRGGSCVLVLGILDSCGRRLSPGLRGWVSE
jgi:hypothetical protein